MTSQPITVRLQPRRLEQLKAIAAALNLSVAEAVSHMIREKIAAGVIPDTIPGIVARRLNDGVSIQIDDHAAVTVSPDIAREMAEALRTVADGNHPFASVLYPDNPSVSYRVSRQGSGIKFELPCLGSSKVQPADAPSFSPDLAHDLADLIEQAAE